MFRIVMPVNSTTEVWTDIKTGLEAGRAWEIVDLHWWFQSIDPTVPLANIITLSASNNYVLQLHRNLDNEVLLRANDQEVLLDTRFSFSLNASGALKTTQPWSYGREPVYTTQRRIRAIFRTAIDDTGLSVATIELAGRILYNEVSTPDVGHTKLGRISEF